MCFTLLCARQLHNAQQDALEKNGVASATKDELDATKVRVETLSSQLQQCRKEVSWGEVCARQCSFQVSCSFCTKMRKSL